MGYLLEHIPPEVKALHEKIGWGQRMGFGERPALVVIDMAKAWTDPESPIGSDMTVTLANINKVLAVARETKPKIPIFFTVMAYDKSMKEFTPLILKKRGVRIYEPLLYGSKWLEIDPVLNRQPDELLIVKKYTSAFLFTNLIQLLISAKVDTLIITGCSISGCVQSTATDASGHGYYTSVVQEAVGDRDPVMATYALLNLDARYADVVPLDETIKYLSKFTG